VPVTARLSKRLYDRFGDEVTDELVTWFNSIDAGYRSELRGLNEVNFARFDATLSERFAQFDAKIDRRFAEFEAKIDRRFADQDAKWEKRIADQDAKWEKRIAELDAKWEKRIAELDAKWEKRFAEQDKSIAGLRVELAQGMHALETRLARSHTEHLRWMFVAWTALLIPIMGLWMRG
jgi:uncharacterized coiled-coil protein SlyX